MTEVSFHHVPVMLAPCLEALAIKPGGIYVDGTMGGAGHSSEIVKRLSGGRLIGFDRDPAAIAASQKRLAAFGDTVTYVNRNHAEVKDALAALGVPAIDGALLDLGVSSHQLDEASRGFSYMHDAPLDMRMNPDDEKSAYDVVNTYSKEDLENIIFSYGEERWAKRIVEFIDDARKVSPIKTTGELVEVIKKAVPKSARRDGPHPAKRTFQAIRIEVNGELRILENAIRDGVDKLRCGGRMAVITFHSLEDRIVKDTFNSLANACVCPKEFPVCVCGKKNSVKVITRKPILPSADEIEVNPRSRSAKLRVCEKIV